MTENDIVIRRDRGYIGVFGSRIDTIANDVSTQAGVTTPPSTQYHITLITKDELRQLTAEGSHNADELYGSASEIDTKHIFALGLGGDPKDVCWVVILWNAGNMFRKKYGLPCKQFHITLSNVDNHTVDKSQLSLRDTFTVDELTLNVIDHLVLSSNLADQHDQAYTYSREMCRRFPESEKSWLRLGDLARRNEQYKLAMLAYARTMLLTPERGQEKVRDHCVKRIFHCASNYTEWGCLFGDDEIEQIPEELRMHLFIPWPETLRQRVMNMFSDEQPQRTQLTREHCFVPLIDRRHPNQDPGR